MANTKKQTEKDVKQGRGIEVKIVPDKDTSPGRVYSNFMLVTKSPYDFTLRFCNAPPIWEGEIPPNKKKIDLETPIVAEVVVPFEVMPGIIDALSNQYEKHLKKHEGIKDGDKKSASQKAKK